MREKRKRKAIKFSQSINGVTSFSSSVVQRRQLETIPKKPSPIKSTFYDPHAAPTKQLTFGERDSGGVAEWEGDNKAKETGIAGANADVKCHLKRAQYLMARRQNWGTSAMQMKKRYEVGVQCVSCM